MTDKYKDCKTFIQRFESAPRLHPKDAQPTVNIAQTAHCDGFTTAPSKAIANGESLAKRVAKSGIESGTKSGTLTPHFDGITYDPARDAKRLGAQLTAVERLLSDGEWRTLPQIAAAVGGSVQGCSARLRDLRKPRHGSHTIARRYLRDGLYEYRMEETR